MFSTSRSILLLLRKVAGYKSMLFVFFLTNCPLLMCCTGNERNPFSKDNIFGPVTYPTHNIVSKVTPPVQEVNRLSCNITPPPVVPCKGKHCSPPSPPSNPPCKGKHCEPPTKTPCKGKHCIDIDLPCIGLHCLPIKPCKGKHCDPSPPTKTPCKEDKWIHKKKEHKHKEHDWEWKPKGLLVFPLFELWLITGTRVQARFELEVG